jgi:hypothetical protein
MTALLDETRIAYASRKVQRLQEDIAEWGGTQGVLEDMVRDANRIAQDQFAFNKQLSEMYTSPSLPASQLLAISRLYTDIVAGWVSTATNVLDAIAISWGPYAAAIPGMDELREYLELAKKVVAIPPIERIFRELVRVWEEDTLYISSSTQILAHPAFQRIIELGDLVVPLLLAEARARPNHLIFALNRITGTDPASPADRGKIVAMAEAWVKWGEAHNLI